MISFLPPHLRKEQLNTVTLRKMALFLYLSTVGASDFKKAAVSRS